MIPQYERGEVGDHEGTFFIIMNPIGVTGDIINSTIVLLSDCYTEKITYLESIRLYLIVGGLCVLVFTFIGIMIASIAADKSINYLWEHLRKKILGAYGELSQNIANRFKDYHEESDSIISAIELQQYKNSEELNFKHSRKYFLLFLPLFIVAGGMYCVLMQPVFNVVQDLLNAKPELIKATYEARFLILDIYFFTAESIIVDTDLGLCTIYDGFTPSPNTDLTGIRLVHQLHSIKQIFYRPEIRPLLSDQVFNSLFNAYPDTSYYLDMGVLSALDLYGTESLVLINSHISLDSPIRGIDLLFATDLTVSLQALSLSIYDDSSNYIQAGLNNFLICVGGFCISLALAYIFYYYPHLRNEEKVVKTLKKLMKNIPSVDMRKSKDDRNHQINFGKTT